MSGTAKGEALHGCVVSSSRRAPPRGTPRTQSLAKLGCRSRRRSRSRKALPKAEAPFVSLSARTEETHAQAKPGAVPPSAQ